MMRLIDLRTLSLAGLAAAAALSLSSCTTTDESTSNTSNITGERVDEKPWNRPQRWEGQGPLGSVMQQQDPAFY